MDTIVVDSSVVIKWFVTEPLSAEARRVLDGYQSGALTLIAPDLLAAEIGNIIWKKYRFQGLAKADAEQIVSKDRVSRQLVVVNSTAHEIRDLAIALGRLRAFG